MNNKSEREKYYMEVNDEIDDDDDHIFSMPQIYINGERIGGYKELQGYLRPQFDYDKLVYFNHWKKIKGYLLRYIFLLEYNS